jgi:hypothetical protein
MSGASHWLPLYALMACKVNLKRSHYMPWQTLRVPVGWGSQILIQSAHEGGKFDSPTHRPSLPKGNIPDTHFCQRLSQPQGRSAAGRIMSMKNSNDTIGNASRDLPICSAVPQPRRHQQRAVKIVPVTVTDGCGYKAHVCVWPIESRKKITTLKYVTSTSNPLTPKDL